MKKELKNRIKENIKDAAWCVAVLGGFYLWMLIFDAMK